MVQETTGMQGPLSETHAASRQDFIADHDPAGVHV
jgi:hypothetical protein